MAKTAKKSQSALYLIGDPKQAIYGFRGGDIFAYLNARSGCELSLVDGYQLALYTSNDRRI